MIHNIILGLSDVGWVIYAIALFGIVLSAMLALLHRLEEFEEASNIKEMREEMLEEMLAVRKAQREAKMRNAARAAR